MSTLMQANAQWSSRPMDERFVSLQEMADHFTSVRRNSRALTVASRRIKVRPEADNKGLVLVGPEGGAVSPTHWAFGQLAQRAEAPAGYLRTLPSPVAADCINYGLHFKREVEDVGMLLSRDGDTSLVSARAITGPRYGRIWNEEIVGGLVRRFGNGRDGPFTVPGEFGQAVEVTKANTTLFAGDQDMFVFLADERNRVEIPDRRNGESGSLARGFFVWNSEVGAATFGVATFLFDYVCCNRIVWGAREYKQVRIRHTPRAPVLWADEVAPALEQMSNASTHSIVEAIEAARAKRLDWEGDDVNDWLDKRFGQRMAPQLHDVMLEEEGRTIETLWDAATAVTAFAKRIGNQDRRVELERKAGDLLDLAVA